jgi:cyanophycinase
LLFLLGGDAAFEVAAREFVSAAGGRGAQIALLLQGGQGWEKYVPRYVEPWLKLGIAGYRVIVPDEDGKLDLQTATATLHWATGIFIGGGHTPTYHRLYATEPIRSVIRKCHKKGVPIAGMSAGALIAPEICVMTSDETEDTSLEVLAGLGLVSDLIVDVHFSERNALPTLLGAMARAQTKTGWGIDEPACAVFENGRFKGALGQSVHEIIMTDFETKAYRAIEHAVSYNKA